jgi:iron complex outermembrane receptor protein
MKGKVVVFFMLCALTAQAQTTVVGKVTDEKYQPLSGVRILSSDGMFVSTDNNGVFKLDEVTDSELITVDQPGFGILSLRFNPRREPKSMPSAAKDTLRIVLPFTSKKLDEVACIAIRLPSEATNHTKLDKEALNDKNMGQDIPFLLDQMPSVVTTSDAGNGIGYSGIRVRGIDASRLNVTINGIPVNDPESHDVYWVNMPDLVSSTQSIDFQRGVSASTNGAAAFGASLNMKTNDISDQASGKLDVSYGSFNSFKTSIQANTGLIKGKYFVETRLSRIGSDGYIDRATSNLRSWYLSAGWVGKQTVLKGVAFSGKEITYQSWYGTPESVVFGNADDRNAYADRNGLSEEQRQNLLNSGRTYNYYTYQNQVDHYQQDNYQLHFTHRFKNQKWVLNSAGHYTYGRGYYEEYRTNDELSTYQMSPVILGGDTITTSDLIRRRWLDNHFIGSVYALSYQGQGVQLTTGGAINNYRGAHFGEVIWSRFASDSDLGDRYYDELGNKFEFSHYAKLQQRKQKFQWILDMQYRYVKYEFLGLDFVSGELKDATQTVDFHFFNPKAAVFYQLKSNHQFYASVGRSNREPVRRDFRESTPSSRPKSEALMDYEVGYTWQKSGLILKGTLYYMDFDNQLVLTGQINDVGGYTRTNVKDSYRRGIELEAKYKRIKNLEFNGNLTLSQNKANNYVDYLDVYLDSVPYYTQQQTNYSQTNLSFSPSVIAGLAFSYTIPAWKLSLDWTTKFVSKQYMDNIQTSELPAFNYSNFGLRKTFKMKENSEIQLSATVNNVFNQRYANNGYAFSYQYAGVKTTERFYYPQAGRNFMVRASITL